MATLYIFPWRVELLLQEFSMMFSGAGAALNLLPID